MTHEPYPPTRPMYPPAVGYQQPQQYPPAVHSWTPPPPAPKQHPLKIIGIICAGLLGVCVLGGVANAIKGSSDPSPATTQAVAVVTPSADRQEPASLSPIEDSKPVKMPDVRGQNAAVAQDYLHKLGFTNIRLGTQDDLDDWVVLPENWTVKKQSMKAGRKVPTDTLIVLTCTKQE
jgi:hypothetical protein